MAQFYKPPIHFNCILVCGFKEAFSYSFGGQFCFFFALLEKTKSIEKIKPINNGYTINKQTNVVKICTKLCNIIFWVWIQYICIAFIFIAISSKQCHLATYQLSAMISRASNKSAPIAAKLFVYCFLLRLFYCGAC